MCIYQTSLTIDEQISYCLILLRSLEEEVPCLASYYFGTLSLVIKKIRSKGVMIISQCQCKGNCDDTSNMFLHYPWVQPTKSGCALIRRPLNSTLMVLGDISILYWGIDRGLLGNFLFYFFEFVEDWPIIYVEFFTFWRGLFFSF